MAIETRKYRTKKGPRWAARWWDPHEEKVQEKGGFERFTAPKGGVLDPNNLRNQVWEKVREAADIPTSITWRNLRHTCGSLMVASGVSLPEVKEYLGHASLVTTESTCTLCVGLRP